MKKLISFIIAFVMILPMNVLNVSAKKQSINYSFLNMWIGQKKTLKINDAKNITWTTSDSTIAAIDKNGKVTARKEGYAVAKGTVGNKDFTCEVLVEKVPKIYPLIKNVGIGQKINFNLVNNDKPIKWYTSDKSKMTITKNGQAYAKKTGSVKMQAKVDGTIFKKSVKIVSKYTDTIYVGTKQKLPSPDKKTKWSSSNKKVISVSKDGQIKVNRSGKATIKGKGKKKTYTIQYKVPEIEISSLKESIYAGQEFDLNIHNYQGKVKWTINNKQVVQLKNKGVIKGLKPGTATVTAQAGKKKFTSTVTVTKALTGYSLVHSHFVMNNKNTEDGMHALFIGDSLTIHPIIKDIWWGKWGMAATEPKYDYPHVFSKMMSQYENVSTDVVSYADWERANGHRSSTYNLIDPYLTGDLDMVVIQLGENSEHDSTFLPELEEFLNYINSKGKKPRIFIFGNYNDAPILDQAKIDICSKYHYKYMSLNDMKQVWYYKSKFNSTVYGDDGKKHAIRFWSVACHPGNIGMKKLASYIYDANVTY